MCSNPFTTNSKIRDCKYVLVNINLPTVFFECKINNFCIIFILIEIVSVNKKKGMADLIVFFYYSCPLYYFMLYRGDGGAAFTWWFYLLLLTFIHLVILVFRFVKIIVAKRIRRRNKSNKNGELPFL